MTQQTWTQYLLPKILTPQGVVMKQAVRFGGIALVLVCLAGCIEVSTVVRVRPDGSGTIEETLLISKTAMRQVEAMMQGMTAQMAGPHSGPGQFSEEFKVLDEAQLRKSAGEMGEGVAYVSSEKITTSEAEGYRATFAFADINKLRLDTSPSDKRPSGLGNKTKDQEALATFRFDRGPPAILRVMLPEELTCENLQPPEMADTRMADDPQAAEIAQKMKEMFKAMKMKIALEVEGNIIRTNATHREGSRITLMELDFDKLLENEENLKKISQQKPQNAEEARDLLKDVPGIKVEFNPELRVEFAGAQLAKPVHSYDQGAIFYMYGKPKAAIESFRKVIEREPRNASAHYAIGISYGALGQYEEALTSINKAIEIDPSKGSYFYGRGNVYLLSGDRDSAIADFKRASMLGNKDADNYLQRTLPPE
jgi:tetratricopeptide (TPR) repeat protein